MTKFNNGMGVVAPQAVEQIGLVGTGTIGSAWAAYFLAQGLDVVATDPGLGAEKKLRTAVDHAWPALRQLGLADDASRERLRFTTSIDTALNNADFVQESTPEREDIKDKVMLAISQAARPDVVIASSTSGILPTRLQAECRQPERLIVGHPFSPVYLVPLVEVVGGQQTTPDTLDWAVEFYEHWGKIPLRCRMETPGHLANRLQDALLCEAMHLIADGVATADELDIALTAGPGLRWALIGSMLTAHLAGGEGGLRAVLDGKFGSTYYSHSQPPVLSDAIVERMVKDTQSQITGRSLTEIEKIRDEFLVGVLKLRADIEAKYRFDRSRFF